MTIWTCPEHIFFSLPISRCPSSFSKSQMNNYSWNFPNKYIVLFNVSFCCSFCRKESEWQTGLHFHLHRLYNEFVKTIRATYCRTETCRLFPKNLCSLTPLLASFITRLGWELFHSSGWDPSEKYSLGVSGKLLKKVGQVELDKEI